MNQKWKVLFICTHNSARSQTAESLLRALFGETHEAYSAGTEPSEINPLAVRAMREIGIDISTHRPKSVNKFQGWHLLRHTFATRAVEAGVDVESLRVIMGHADMKTLLKYVHVSEEYKSRVIKKLKVTE